MPNLSRRRLIGALAAVAALTLLPAARAADTIAVIAKVKASVVAIGTYQRTRTPAFQFLGTGFVVGDGTVVVTNQHVLPAVLDARNQESIAVLLPGLVKDSKDQVQLREAKQFAIDPPSDLALLRMQGSALPALKLRDSDTIREGQDVLFTGFPIGAVLGPYPATHRGMISVVTPIAIPQARAADLDAATARRLTAGSYPVFQMDATAYPGNSGSPVYDPETGEVLGIVNMVMVKGTKESALSQPSGITYAVPSKHLETLLKTAK